MVCSRFAVSNRAVAGQPPRLPPNARPDHKLTPGLPFSTSGIPHTMKINWKEALTTGLIAIVAVIVFNKFILPALPDSLKKLAI